MMRAAAWFLRVIFAAVIGVAILLLAFRGAAALRESQTPASAAPQTGRFVRAADIDMFVQEAGPPDGIPVVLIHGTGAWSEIWRETMNALAAAGFHAVALDMPPFGFSQRPPKASYGDDAQARRILGALDSLGLTSAVL